jgi:hypothetical protein
MLRSIMLCTIRSRGDRNKNVANSSVIMSSSMIAAKPAHCAISTSRVNDGSNSRPRVNTCYHHIACIQHKR